MIEKPRLPQWSWAAAPAAISVLFDLVAFEQGAVHALAVGAVVMAAAAVSWRVLPRTDLMLVCAATAAVWPLLHAAATASLVVTALMSGLYVVPAQRRGSLEVATGAAAALVVLAAGQSPLHAVGAAVVAVVLLLLRPRLPTEGTLMGLRTGALFVPSSGCAAALILNVASGRGDARGALANLEWSFSLVAFLVLITVALLGLGTLLASSSPAQAAAWASLSVAAAAFLVSSTALDPSRSLGAVSYSAPTIAFLSTIAAARARTYLGPSGSVAFAFPPIFAAFQLWLTV